MSESMAGIGFKSKVLSELRDDEGCWLDPAGCHHDTAADYIGALLGFCGCGNPESALIYVRDSLAGIDACQKVGFEAWRERDAQFASTGERNFVWYQFDRLGLIEHGGSVPGWLTDKGADWLLALNEALSADAKAQP